jgi:Flp pilus assembly protein TadD
VLFFAPLALFWIAIGAGPEPAPTTARRWRWGLAFAIGLVLAIAPATLRNLVVGKDRVLVSSNGGLNLFIGNNPIGRGTYLPLDQIARAAGVGGAENAAIDVSWMITDPSGRRVAEAARGRPLAPSEVSDFWAERAFAAMRADPGRTLRIFGRKLLLVWNATEIPQIEDPALYRDLIPFLRGPLVRFGWVAPLALLGVAFALRNGAERRRWNLILLFALAFTLSIAVFFVTARYRVPIAPVVLLLAAYASEQMVAIARRSWRAVILPVAALAGCASIVHLDLVRFDRSAAYVSLGIALAEEGRNDAAITAFQRAIALAPGDPVAPMNLGTAFLKAGRNAEAAATFRTGATRFPRTMSLWRGLGESEALLGNAAAAAAAFRQAAMIEPRDPYLWFRVGGAEFVAGRVDSARAALARGDALDPGNEAIRDLRARMEAEIAKRSGGGP